MGLDFCSFGRAVACCAATVALGTEFDARESARELLLGFHGGRAARAGDIRVLLVADDGAAERSILSIFKSLRVAAEWAKTASALESRAARDDLKAPEVVFLDLELPQVSGEDAVTLVRSAFSAASVVALGGDLDGERAARLLGVGVPSLNKPVSPLALAGLALRLSAKGTRAALEVTSASERSDPESGWIGQLESALRSYAEFRALSSRQCLILRLYLSGQNDKQIADTISCSKPTVYEHWRRIGKKAGGSTKADAIDDFHRFLVGN